MGGGRQILVIWFDFLIEKPSETFTLDLEVFGFMSINSPPQAKKIDLPHCLLPPPPLFFPQIANKGGFWSRKDNYLISRIARFLSKHPLINSIFTTNI